MNWVYEFLYKLPGQIEGTKSNFQELFDAYSASLSAMFKPDTNEDTLGNDNEKMDSRDVVQPPVFVTAALKIK